MSFSDRLKETRGVKGLSQQALAELSGVSQSTIANIESGRNLGSKNLIQIAKALDTNAEWLLTGKGPQEPTEKGTRYAEAFTEALEQGLNDPEALEKRRQMQHQLRSATRIPVFEYQLDATTGEPKALLHRGRAFFVRDIGIRSLRDCKAIFVTDSSMEPFVYQGDIVAIETSKTRPQEARIYAVMFEGDVLIRQIFKQTGGLLVLRAFNNKYPDKTVAGNSDPRQFAILGECFHRSASNLGHNEKDDFDS